MNFRFFFAVFLPLSALALAPTGRVANTTLAMPPALPPATTNSYTTSNAFPTLSFANPIALAVPPGETNRLFVCERAGRILVITNLAQPNLNVFLNMTNNVGNTHTNSEGGLLSMAFHPNYASNGQFFVWYTAHSPVGVFTDRLSRFQVSATNANVAATNETVFIGQFDQANNHNGADIKFGPDGYLYLAFGDEGGGCDNYRNSQMVTGDFFAVMIRIDVDKKPGSLAPNHHAAIVAPTNYAIPPDNPFVGATQFNGVAINTNRLRAEIYATGLRNPWRFSFDGPGGLLYLNDVGQALWEEVNLIRSGGNYGWYYREGLQSNTCSAASPGGFTNWVNPVLQYAHGAATNQGYAIAGGHVYRGSKFLELYGRYIFDDYSSGHIWSMTHDGTNATSFRWLATDNNIAYILPDPRDGELLFADLGGQIKKLEYAAATTNALPATLAATGIFTNTATLATAPGVVEFDVNQPLWSDGASKRRWFCVPTTNLFITFDAKLPWTSPTSTVWVKHFELLLTSGVPASARRLETRVLVKNNSGNGGYGVTYRWGTSLTNATLVPDSGLDEPFVINDGGTIRTQVWHYPSRGECLACHQPAAGFVLGLNTAQLNRDFDYGNAVTNQLRALNSAGYFATNISSFAVLPALANLTNSAWSAEWRVRSYLQANCANCHFPGSSVPANFDARIVNPLSQCGIVNGALNNNLGNTNNRVVVPGATNLSVLLHRISVRGTNQMPPLGSSLADTQAIAFVAAWIQSLAGHQTFAQWQLAQFGSTNATGTGETEDFDGDGSSNGAEYLLGTQPTNAASAWGIDTIQPGPDGLPRFGFTRIANRGFEAQATTNLLDALSWQWLEIPALAPVFAASNSSEVIDGVAATNMPRQFIRIRAYEP